MVVRDEMERRTGLKEDANFTISKVRLDKLFRKTGRSSREPMAANLHLARDSTA